MGKHYVEQQTILLNSESWTGRDPYVTRRYRFKSKTMLPLFMVYDLYHNGDPEDPYNGRVLFTTMDWTPSRMCYRYFPRLATWMSHLEWSKYPDWLFYPFADLTTWLNSWRHKE